MTRKTQSTQDKIGIVMEHLTNTSIETAELCRRHNLSPRTFYKWRERFLQAGCASLSGRGHKSTEERQQREIESLKKIVGEYAVANAVLKKTLEAGRQKVTVVTELKNKGWSTRMALQYSGATGETVNTIESLQDEGECRGDPHPLDCARGDAVFKLGRGTR